MTSMRTTTNSTQTAAGHPCGCSELGDDACVLECLEKPRFSCGQLLTDQDLTALVEWSKKKAALNRYRQGWGVVCGLNVYSSGREGEIKVGSGYALDCCGNDIVVCGETTFSVDSCCKPDSVLSGHAATPERTEIAGMQLENLRVIDVSLLYAEAGGRPQATLGGANCGFPSGCEYSRTKETYQLKCTVGAANSDPVRTQAENWLDGYQKCLDVVRRYQEECGKAKGEDLQRWLKRWLDKNPMQSFCFMKEWIQERQPEEWNEEMATRALFWIVQDCRNAYLQNESAHCATESGVPLARVWVRAAKAGSAKPKCEVVAVDSLPPYRRLIQKESWLAPLGNINAGQLIWRRAEEAQAILNKMGLRTKEPAEFAMPTTAKGLQDELEAGKVMVASDSVAKIQYMNCGTLGFRVVGIR